MAMNMAFIRKIYFTLLFSGAFIGWCCVSHVAVADPEVVPDNLYQSRDDRSGSSVGIAANHHKNEKKVICFCYGIRHAITAKKVVALTFDDGPHKQYTNEILGVLKQYGVKGTFFLIGENAEKYPEIVKTIYADGHVIGNHSYSHNYLTKLSNDELTNDLTKTENLIYGVIKNSPALFRPPYGACSYRSAKLIKQLGFSIVMWSSTAEDFHAWVTPEKIAANVIQLVKPGAIVTLHDGGGNRRKTVQALPIIIDILKGEGYEFLTVPELLGVNAYFPQSLTVDQAAPAVVAPLQNAIITPVVTDKNEARI